MFTQHEFPSKAVGVDTEVEPMPAMKEKMAGR